MCRFVFYMGPEIRMASLVTEPVHSIVVQSYHSEERDEPLNGDGFGVAWYPADAGECPAVFKSISPAWSNQNLRHLSRVIRSRCILAHVRAATPGLPVSEINCHPFLRGDFAFMHNGGINEFGAVNRPLRRALSDASYAGIMGTTDSEAIFAIFFDQYSSIETEHGVEKMATALEAAIETIEALLSSTRHSAGCDLNLVVSDGRVAVASRYSSKNRKPNSLYLHAGHSYRCDRGEAKLSPCAEPTILIASEPLTRDASWQAIEANRLVTIDESLDVDIRPINVNQHERPANEHTAIARE